MRLRCNVKKSTTIIGKRITTLIQEVYVPYEIIESFVEALENEFDVGTQTLNSGIEVPYDSFKEWEPRSGVVDAFRKRVLTEADSGVEIDGFLFTLPED